MAEPTAYAGEGCMRGYRRYAHYLHAPKGGKGGQRCARASGEYFFPFLGAAPIADKTAGAAPHFGPKKRHPSGGTATVRVHGIPWAGTGCASTPPRLPQPLPPYEGASLLSSSRQSPPDGTPTKTLDRGT